MIQKAFKDSGMNIKQLSDRSGVPYSACWGIINKGRDAQMATVDKLCKTLGLKLVRKDD